MDRVGGNRLGTIHKNTTVYFGLGDRQTPTQTDCR